MEQKLPTTKGLQIIVVYVVMAVISTITFALRVYVRSSMVKRSWEDWAAGFGWFVYILFCCVTIVGPFYGTGQHADLVTPENLSIALRQWYLSELTYVITNLAVKLSIALMLLRVTVEVHQKRLIYIVTGVFEIYSFLFLFAFAFQCMPASLFWTKHLGGVEKGRCVGTNVIVGTGYTFSALTVVYDWTMAILPWFVVRKMQLDLRTRRMIALVLALGSIASIATLIRIPYVADLASTKDFLYDNVNLAIWACIETGLSITASSVATLKPLFRRTSSPTRRSYGLVTPKLNTINLTTIDSDATTVVKNCDVEVSEVPHDGIS